jgi:hypothetical protein
MCCDFFFKILCTLSIVDCVAPLQGIMFLKAVFTSFLSLQFVVMLILLDSFLNFILMLHMSMHMAQHAL